MGRSIVYCPICGGPFDDVSTGPCEGDYREDVLPPTHTQVGTKLSSLTFLESGLTHNGLVASFLQSHRQSSFHVIYTLLPICPIV